MNVSYKTWGLCGLALFFLSGCVVAEPDVVSPVTGRVSPTYDGPSELAYCASTIVYSDVVTVSGTAVYKARELYGTPGAGGLGNPGSARPIRRAEVRVTNSSGQVIQCGTTSNTGTFAVDVPRGSSTYTVSINARGNNSYVKASVLDAPERNNLYSLSTTFSGAANVDVGTLTAEATGDVLGAAFNIYDQILIANEYLRSQVANCSTAFAGCPDFTVAPKVSAYWEKGFNPGDYFGTSGLSFYLKGYSRLFILGGIDSDIDTQDTDHFDNSVILHEYGHFLEDIFAASDSPGGSHSGNKLIDPRLAWSEGWGNFIQGAIRNSSYYVDTRGNIDGSTDYIFNINIETPDAGCIAGDTTPGCDVPVFAGEGNFREFAITRFLFDAVDPATGDDSVTGAFNQLWASMTMPTGGFPDASYAFRQVGLLHEVQMSLSGTTDMSGTRTLYKQSDDRQDYGAPVTSSMLCGPNTFTAVPYSDSGDIGYTSSHLLKNNDFYMYYHAGGYFKVKLNYTTTAGTEADLDLYVYNESAYLGDPDDVVGSSTSDPSGGIGTSETESVTVSSLPAGFYLINVHTYIHITGGPGGTTNYDLKLVASGGGETYLCP